MVDMNKTSSPIIEEKPLTAPYEHIKEFIKTEPDSNYKVMLK